MALTGYRTLITKRGHGRAEATKEAASWDLAKQVSDAEGAQAEIKAAVGA